MPQPKRRATCKRLSIAAWLGKESSFGLAESGVMGGFDSQGYSLTSFFTRLAAAGDSK